MENKIKISLFGCVRLANGTVSLDEGVIHSNRLLPLLVYFIVNRGAAIPNRQLCEQFVDGEYRNPEGTLKNLMYRLRGILKALGPEEYICTLPGGYRWNPKLAVETDYEQFEQLCAQIEEEQDVRKKKDLCMKAITCYNGNFSPGIAEETWLLPKGIQYQTQYVDTVKQLGDIYEKEQEWGLLEQLCRDVLVQEPLEEDIHCRLIRSLQRQKKYNQALAHHEGAKKLFYENFGIWNPKRLQQAFDEVTSDIGISTSNLETVLREFFEPKPPDGAFFCDYQVFQQICRLEMRRVGRIGISEYILLRTLRRPGGLWSGAAIDSGLMAGAEALEEILRDVLRIGDAVTRSGPAQFVVLLSSCAYEAGIAVAGRISREFKKKVRKQRIELKYELGEISSPWQEMGVTG